MKHFPVIQGSPEWIDLRLGKPTASRFEKILTPTGKLSTQSAAYLSTLVAERILGYALDAVTTAAMEAGREKEPDAVEWYELAHGVETEVCGICFNDDGTVGASPDRFVGSDGLLEIKCPMPNTHVGYLLGDGHAKDYWPQVQGQLWIAERAWLDAVSYCPGFPASLARTHRDDAFIAKLEAALGDFCVLLEEATARILEMGKL